MAEKSQQLPRAVPNTLLEVQFVQRGGKLYKVLLPIPLKHNSPTSASISQPVTSPIVFEARSAKGLENVTRKLNEPSPFLKPVTLSPAEYKAIPLFTRGERIIDTNWLPEETDCIIQLVKNHKAFQDTNIACTENIFPKIVSINSNDAITVDELTKDIVPVDAQKEISSLNENPSEFSSPTNQTVRCLVDDVSEIVDGQRNFAIAFLKNHEEQILTTHFEKITPVCELKVEPLPSSNIKMLEVHPSRVNSSFCTEPKSTLSVNGENCIIAEVKPDTSSLLNKTKSLLPTCSGDVKIAEVQHNDSTNILSVSREVNSGNLKTVSALPNGKYFISLKENTNYSAKQGTIKVLSNDNNIPLTEDTKSVLSINPGNKSVDVSPKGIIPGASTEETSLLLEKLKNARTVKIHPHGSNSASIEETEPVFQANLRKPNTKEFNPDRGSCAMSPSSKNSENGRILKTTFTETTPISPVQNNKMQIKNQSLQKSLSDTNFPTSSAIHGASPYAPLIKKVMLRLQRAENPLNSCGVPAKIALMDHDYALKDPCYKEADKHSTLSPENYDNKNSCAKGNYTLRSVLRQKSHSADVCTFAGCDKMLKNTLTMHSKARGRKPSLTFQGAHVQNCTEKTGKSINMAVSDNNIINLQQQKFIDGKPLLAFPVTSTTEKQNTLALERTASGFVNNPALIKSVVKFLMPKSFSNTCSSENTAQALNRIAQLKSVAGRVHKGSTSTNSHEMQSKYTKTYIKPQTSNAHISTASHNPSENISSSVSHTTKDTEESSSEVSNSSTTDEEFNIMEPEVLIIESKDTFIFEDGKLKLCPSRKPVRKKKNFKKLPNNSKGKRTTNHVPSKSTSDEIKLVANDVKSKEISSEENHITNDVQNKETSNASLKRTGKDLESIHKTKCQRESLLPPSPKVRKLFICRTEKATSSLLQSCFVWLDKMDEQFLNDGRLDTTEVSEDILFNISDASRTYCKSQRSHRRYGSKAAYLDENPFVVIEPPSSKPAEVKSELNEQNDGFSIEKVEERKADSRMADVLRLLDEKRKAIEALRKKNMSHAIPSTVSQT